MGQAQLSTDLQGSFRVRVGRSEMEVLEIIIWGLLVMPFTNVVC